MSDDKAKELSIEQQLLLLKDLTLRLGQVSGAQLHQLRMWGLLYPGIATTKAEVDTEKRTVTIHIYGNEFRPTKQIRLLSENIERWVRFILWNETRVIVKRNDKKVIWDSERTEERVIKEKVGTKEEKN